MPPVHPDPARRTDELHKLWMAAAVFCGRYYPGVQLYHVQLKIDGEKHFDTSVPTGYSAMRALPERRGDVLHELFVASSQLVQRRYPGHQLLEVSLMMTGQRPFCCSVPLKYSPMPLLPAGRHFFTGPAAEEAAMLLERSREGMDPDVLCVPEEFDESSRATHSEDFRSVNWYGKSYSFTPLQAAIVRLLWSAMEDGHWEVSGASLLVESESDATQLRDVFRRGCGAAAWGKLIVEGESRGSYRLAPPPADG